MIGTLPLLLLAAILPRGARPRLEAPKEGVPGVVMPGRGRGSSRGFKLLVTALKMMPTYGCSADRNAAKRKRRALRAAGVPRVSTLVKPQKFPGWFVRLLLKLGWKS